MISIIKQTKHPNILGVTASGLCLVHCLMTPVFFSIQASTLGIRTTHWSWWQLIDLVFLFISLIAIFISTSRTTKLWMKFALWSAWILLAGIILNEKLGILEIPEAAIYFPSVALILLHLYNRNYCKCVNDHCCANSSET